MSRASRVLLVFVGLAFLGVLVWFSASHSVGPSTYSRNPRGLQLAYDYLVAREVPVGRWERPLTRLPFPQLGSGEAAESDGGDALVLALPFERPLSDQEVSALDSWVVAGGRLVVLGSGGSPGAAEALWLRSLGLESRPHRGRPPLWWWSWRAWQEVEQQLVAEPDGEGQVPADMPLLTVRPGKAVLVSLEARDRRVLQRFPDAGQPSELG